MAEQTVREQLAEALEASMAKSGHHPNCCVSIPHRNYGCSARCQQARRALARHRAEPPADFEPCKCDGPECPGYQEGLEAQRERVGGGTA